MQSNLYYVVEITVEPDSITEVVFSSEEDARQFMAENAIMAQEYGYSVEWFSSSSFRALEVDRTIAWTTQLLILPASNYLYETGNN